MDLAFRIILGESEIQYSFRVRGFEGSIPLRLAGLIIAIWKEHMVAMEQPHDPPSPDEMNCIWRPGPLNIQL